MIDRRHFIAGAILSGGVWPITASAQQPVMPQVGMLGSATLDEWTSRLAAFRAGLGEAGFAEGRNVVIEYRWASGHNDRLPDLAADLVSRRVAVIAVIGNAPSVQAAKRATTTIPIVFRAAVDPIAAGFVESIGRPGGNITGVTTLGVELGPKQLEFLHELVPTAVHFALLINPTNPIIAEIGKKTMPAIAARMGLQLHIFSASTNPEIDATFAEMSRIGVSALIVSADSFFNSRNKRIAELAIRYRIPTITPYREFAESGGLLSYGGSINDGARQAGVYVGRILKGEKPGDLPIVRPVKFELVVNNKTVKTLGLAIPRNLLAFADEVIE